MNIVLDFDSTLIQAESLDILAAICNRSKTIQEEIKHITNLGMIGEISIQESLSQRIKLINATPADLSELIVKLFSFISPSIVALTKMKSIFPKNCYVVSGGFLEYIMPVCKRIGFLESNIIANQFVLKDDNIIDFNRSLPIAHNMGKVKVINEFQLARPICMIGDGYTDLEAKLEGAVDYFIGYTETVYRDNIVERADAVCSDFYEVVKFIKENG
jgi:HAD superfamily phosphoserine phosphatase-like hydrolase